MSATNPTSHRKSRTLHLRIPRKHLLPYQVCAEHFGTTPEAIMQCDTFGELGVVMDSPFRGLLCLNEAMRETDDMQPVTLSFLPSAFSFLETLSALVRQPLEEFVAGLVCSSAETLACYVMDAMNKGGLDACPHLVEWAKRWLKFEFETRRGRIPVDNNDFDLWESFEVETLRPACFSNSAADHDGEIELPVKLNMAPSGRRAVFIREEDHLQIVRAGELVGLRDPANDFSAWIMEGACVWPDNLVDLAKDLADIQRDEEQDAASHEPDSIRGE